MNFFKLYIGDYQRDTAHLSVTEHGAYLLMLQHYYATEKPLPTGKALHRMLRAQDKAEREAIDAVAAQFWRETEHGLVNNRADVEITKAGAQAETNRSIAQAREAKRKASREGNERSTNRATNDQPNHSHSHSQTLSSRDTESTATTVAPDPTPGARVCLALKAHGISGNPSHPMLLALIAAGATAQEFVNAAPSAAGKADPFAYLLGVVKGQRRDAAEAAQGLHKGAMPTPQGKPPTAAELRVFRSSPQIMDPTARARCEAFTNAGHTAPDTHNVIDMESPNGLAIGLD